MKGGYWGLAFSPDSEAVFYVFSPKNTADASLFQIPVLGGPPRKVLEDINTAPAFSPDGTRMAFIRGTADGGQVRSCSPTPTAQTSAALASRADSDDYAHDARRLVSGRDAHCGIRGRDTGQRSRIVLVNVETGKEQDVQRRAFRLRGTARVARRPQRAGVRCRRAGRRPLEPKQPSLVPRLPGRHPAPDHPGRRQLSQPHRHCGRADAAGRKGRDAGRSVGGAGRRHRARPADHGDQQRPEGASGIDWTRDGRIVYSGIRRAAGDIWIANADGSQPRQLTSHPGMENRAAAAARWQEHHLSIPRVRRGRREVWSHRTRRRQSTRRSTPAAPYSVDTCSHRRHLYFKALEKGGPVAYRVPLGGGPRDRCSPIRHVYLRDSTCAASRPTNGGPSASTGTAELRASRSCPSTAPGRCAHSVFSPARGGHRLHLGTGWPRVRRPGLPRRGEQPVAVPARRLGAPGRDDVHVGADLAYRWSRDGKTLAMSRGTPNVGRLV